MIKQYQDTVTMLYIVYCLIIIIMNVCPLYVRSAHKQSTCASHTIWFTITHKNEIIKLILLIKPKSSLQIWWKNYCKYIPTNKKKTSIIKWVWILVLPATWNEKKEEKATHNKQHYWRDIRSNRELQSVNNIIKIIYA